MDSSVVILNYNTRELLRECLLSLARSRNVEFDTQVVDNSSVDGSAEMVRQEFPDVHLHQAPNNGYGAGNNIALRQILGKSGRPRTILLLNADTVVPPDAIRGLLDFVDQHSDVGVVGPKVLRADGSLDLACRRSFPTPEVSFYRLTGLSKVFPHSRRFGRYNLTYLDENEITEVDSVVGACMLIRTVALEQAGLFDEEFFMYGEDLDLALRIKQKMWKIYYYPRVSITHYKRESSKGSARAQREFWRAMYIFYRKHYASTTPRPIHWLVLFGLALRGGRAAFENQSVRV